MVLRENVYKTRSEDKRKQSKAKRIQKKIMTRKSTWMHVNVNGLSS